MYILLLKGFMKATENRQEDIFSVPLSEDQVLRLARTFFPEATLKRWVVDTHHPNAFLKIYFEDPPNLSQALSWFKYYYDQFEQETSQNSSEASEKPAG